MRLLFVLADFEGWHPHDDWKDLTFYVTHGNQIERIAIVGDERWRSESLMFAGADLRTAPVEFFADDDLAGARAWLSACATIHRESIRPSCRRLPCESR